MFKKKNDYLDESRELPGFVKGLIALLIIGGMLFATIEFCKWDDEQNMKLQYPNEYINFE